jgi:hypothetical protein
VDQLLAGGDLRQRHAGDFAAGDKVHDGESVEVRQLHEQPPRRAVGFCSNAIGRTPSSKSRVHTGSSVADRSP